jgi:hypothetical protein
MLELLGELNAEQGRFPEAVRTMRQALSGANEPGMAEKLKIGHPEVAE